MTSGTGTTETARMRTSTGPALDAAQRHAMEWLDSVDERPIRPELDVDGMLARLVADPARGRVWRRRR